MLYKVSKSDQPSNGFHIANHNLWTWSKGEILCNSKVIFKGDIVNASFKEQACYATINNSKDGLFIDYKTLEPTNVVGRPYIHMFVDEDSALMHKMNYQDFSKSRYIRFDILTNRDTWIVGNEYSMEIVFDGIIFGRKNKSLHRVNPGNGARIWSTDISSYGFYTQRTYNGRIVEEPYEINKILGISAGNIITYCGNGLLAGFDIKSGEEAFKFNTGRLLHGAKFDKENKVIFGFLGSDYYEVNILTRQTESYSLNYSEEYNDLKVPTIGSWEKNKLFFWDVYPLRLGVYDRQRKEILKLEDLKLEQQKVIRKLGHINNRIFIIDQSSFLHEYYFTDN